ncbi:MAG: AraC family transcriptional regulator [Paenibacillaceae bacterium]|jgi:AraC-like DNA-binding protein|nr:AraC family transcriptional regulator [Paenibacillaceae bacterium]
MNILKRVTAKHFFNRKSTFFTLLTSFIIVLLLPVSITAVMYERTVSLMEENAQRYNLAMLEQLEGVIDNGLNEVDNIAYQVMRNPKLQELLLAEPGVSPDSESDARASAYTYVNIASDLLQYKGSSRFVDDMYVYLAATDVVLTPSSKGASRLFYDNIYSYENMTYGQWKKDMLEAAHFQTYWKSMRLHDGNKARNVITYTQSLPLGQSERVKGQLVVLINEQQIMEMIEKINWANRGSILIWDERGELITTTSADPALPGRLQEKIAGESGFHTFQAEGKSQMAVYTVSQETGWNYVSVSPKAEFLGKANTMKNRAVLLLGICLIGGALLSYTLAHRNYSPVKEVVRTIQREQGSREGNIENEFQFIKESLAKGLYEEKQLRSIVNRQGPVIRANFLGRLIRGTVDKTAITQETLDMMDIHFPYERFAVVIVHIDDCSGFIKEESEAEWTFIRFIIANLGEDLLQGSCVPYVSELDKDSLAFLINVPNEAANAVKDQLRYRLDQLISLVSRKFATTCTAAVSSVHEGIQGIGAAYREACRAIDYKFFIGTGSTILYEETGADENYYFYEPEVEAQLINYVKSGDYASAEQILNQLYERNIKSRKLSPELGKCLYSDIVGTSIKAALSFGNNYEQIFEGVMKDPIERIAACKTFEEMLEEVKKLFLYLCDHMKNNRTDRSEWLLASMTRYIQEHYGDSMLSLQSIAAQFQRTVPYLSTFFKNRRGQTISDYIAEVRIEQAKKLLQNSSLTIAQVAQEVGYANDVGFIRLFKKHEGITPGKFRELHL